jgi:hypothetical protein
MSEVYRFEEEISLNSTPPERSQARITCTYVVMLGTVWNRLRAQSRRIVHLKLGADSVEPSTPRELFPLPVVDTGWSPYDTAPDGQRFLVRATPGQAGQPLTVIVNWLALLKKGATAP